MTTPDHNSYQLLYPIKVWLLIPTYQNAQGPGAHNWEAARLQLTVNLQPATVRSPQSEVPGQQYHSLGTNNINFQQLNSSDELLMARSNELLLVTRPRSKNIAF